MRPPAKTFLKVSIDSKEQPRSTFLSAMVSVSECPGYRQPLVLAGGADMSCAGATPPCKVCSASLHFVLACRKVAGQL